MRAISLVSQKIREFLTEGKQRSLKAKKNILASIAIKGGSMLISFLMVPLTIEYVNKEQYGIWLTLSSLFAWLSFFDIGLDRGMQNRFAEAVANNDKEMARTYVSSTYAILSVITLVLLGAFLIANPFLNWGFILEAPQIAGELTGVALIVFSFFCLKFVLNLIGTILRADQRPAMGGFLNLIANFLSLAIIFFLSKTTEGSLYNLALAVSITPAIVLGFAHIYFFTKDYKEYVPSLKYVKRAHFKDLTSLGFQFFVIQIIFIVIYETDNMIITHLLGPEQVTTYGIAHKYFGMAFQGFMIIITPFWAAYTEAYQKEDYDWIKRTNSTLIKIWGLLVVACVGMLLISDMFYGFWVPSVEVPFDLSLFMGIYVITLTWGNIFAIFVNGVGKVRLQMICSVIGGILNIPLSILFAETLGMGLAGIIFASTLCSFYSPVFGPIQYKKIINKTARGIWDR